MMTLRIDTGEMVRSKFEDVRLVLAGYLREAKKDDENGADDWSPNYVLECLQEIEEKLNAGMQRLSNDVVLQVPEGSDAVIVEQS
jgi:hypothetical protein